MWRTLTRPAVPPGLSGGRRDQPGAGPGHRQQQHRRGAWTQDTATQAAGVTMPVYDNFQFTSVGIVGQPAIDWQNRPSFQQVAPFPAHR